MDEALVNPGIILSMGSSNERRRYNITASPLPKTIRKIPCLDIGLGAPYVYYAFARLILPGKSFGDKLYEVVNDAASNCKWAACTSGD